MPPNLKNRAARIAKGFVLIEYGEGVEKWFSPEMLVAFEKYHRLTPGSLADDHDLLREVTRAWAESMPTFIVPVASHIRSCGSRPLPRVTWAYKPENA